MIHCSWLCKICHLYYHVPVGFVRSYWS